MIIKLFIKFFNLGFGDPILETSYSSTDSCTLSCGGVGTLNSANCVECDSSELFI